MPKLSASIEQRRVSSYSPDNEWSPAEVQRLVDAWANNRSIREIEAILVKRDARSILRKAFRLGLPARRAKKKYEAIDPTEDLLELDDDDPRWAYLDRNYTREEVEAVYAGQPKPKLRQAYCKNGCGTLCAFESPYQRWCEPCRKELSKIADDGY